MLHFFLTLFFLSIIRYRAKMSIQTVTQMKIAVIFLSHPCPFWRGYETNAKMSAYIISALHFLILFLFLISGHSVVPDFVVLQANWLRQLIYWLHSSSPREYSSQARQQTRHTKLKCFQTKPAALECQEEMLWRHWLVCFIKSVGVWFTVCSGFECDACVWVCRKCVFVY